jgi:MFS family permease
VTSYWRLLRTNRDFRLLYLGTLVSLGGDWFLTVALLDLVLQLTSSATLASLMLLCQTLPIFFFTPLAGHIVDKVDRRRLMIVVDLMRTGACLLPLLARTPAMLPFAYLGVILISIGSAYFEPASQAALPNIVAPEELGPANVLMGSTWGTMLAVGAAIGGAVTMRFGRDLSFIVDAASFLGSAIVLRMMRARFSEERSPTHEHPPLLESMRETVRYAKKTPRILALLAVKGGYGTGAGTIAMLSVFGKEVFNAGAMGIGLLFAARGVGALLGPFLIRGLIKRDDAQYRAITLCVLAFGAGYMVLGFSKTLAVGLAGILLAHLGGGAAWQTSTYGLQRESPDWIRGRIFSADYGFLTLTMSLSSLAAGMLSDRFGPVIATVGISTLTLAWALFWCVWTWKLWNGARASRPQ